MKQKILLTVGITLVVIFAALSALTNPYGPEGKKNAAHQEIAIK